MHDNVICSKLTTKPHLRELFSNLCHLQTTFNWVTLSSLLLWEFVHDNIYKFTLRKRSLVVETSQSDISMHKGYFPIHWQVVAQGSVHCL